MAYSLDIAPLMAAEGQMYSLIKNSRVFTTGDMDSLDFDRSVLTGFRFCKIT